MHPECSAKLPNQLEEFWSRFHESITASRVCSHKQALVDRLDKLLSPNVQPKDDKSIHTNVVNFVGYYSFHATWLIGKLEERSTSLSLFLQGPGISLDKFLSLLDRFKKNLGESKDDKERGKYMTKLISLLEEVKELLAECEERSFSAHALDTVVSSMVVGSLLAAYCSGLPSSMKDLEGKGKNFLFDGMRNAIGDNNAYFDSEKQWQAADNLFAPASAALAAMWLAAAVKGGNTSLKNNSFVRQAGDVHRVGRKVLSTLWDKQRPYSRAGKQTHPFPKENNNV